MWENPKSPTEWTVTLARLEACIEDIRKWMPLNSLKLNDSETEFLCLQSKNIPTISPPSILIGDEAILPSSSACCLGVIFDDKLSLSPQVCNICKTASFHGPKVPTVYIYPCLYPEVLDYLLLSYSQGPH